MVVLGKDAGVHTVALLTLELFEVALRDLEGSYDLAPEGTRPTPRPIVLERVR